MGKVAADTLPLGEGLRRGARRFCLQGLLKIPLFFLVG